MEFSGRERLRGGINMVPLINIVFLLLIFFMLSSTLVTPDSLEVTLPESETARAVESQPIVLVVDSQGRIAINNREVRADEVASRLAGVAETHAGASLVIKADAKATYAELGPLLHAAKTVGIARIALATREPDPKATAP
jgi:biopolymer transport protein ExbD